jgi:hypothetical protein
MCAKVKTSVVLTFVGVPCKRTLRCQASGAHEQMTVRPTNRGWYRAVLCAALAAWAAAWLALQPKPRLTPHPAPLAGLASLSELLSLPPGRISQVPIARMNLLCAQHLSPANEPNLDQCESTVKAWAKRIASETERHWYRFRQNPAEFENSEGFFRMLILTVVLAEDFGVHYDEQRKVAPAGAHAADGFFSDPEDVFLHGLLGPKRQGTCSSMPVLYIAVGRELGYPLKLVTTKAHLFVRWDGAGERFNVEATGRGLNRFNDDYYRHWPFEVSPAEEATQGYLKSLTPAEELSVFLSIRGMCLREAGKIAEAAEIFAAAARLAPTCHAYREMQASLQAQLGHEITQRTPIANTF